MNTQRLRLVPLALSHAEDLHALSVDPEVRRYLYQGKIIPETQVQEIIRTSESCFERFASGFFALFINLDTHPLHGQFAGFCGHRLFENEVDMELLFGMNPAVWGHGFGGEAARAVLHHGFRECGFPRVIAATDTPNQRSVRVLQKLGMSFHERREWHGLDTVFYELTAHEFLGDSTAA